MTGDPVGARSGAVGSLYLLQLMGQDGNGGSRGRVLRRGVQRFSGGDPGGTTVPNHFQYGRGRSGASLGLTGDRGSKGSGWVGGGGASPHHLIIRGQRPGCVHRP